MSGLPTVPLGRGQSWKDAEDLPHPHIRRDAYIGARYLKKDRLSSIIFITGSTCEKSIADGWMMLTAIGAATPGLTRQLAFDLAPIRVNCIAPGVVATDLWSGMGKDWAEAYLKDHEDKMLTRKVAQLEDVTEAFLYVMMDANTTGQAVHTNSGVFLIKVDAVEWKAGRSICCRE